MPQSHPHASLILFSDSSGESQLRELIRGLCRDVGLAIPNPVDVPTHRSGSSIDLVLALRISRDLILCNKAVHDGNPCACPPDLGCPVLGSDHKLMTFQAALSSLTKPHFPRCNASTHSSEALGHSGSASDPDTPSPAPTRLVGR